MASLSIRDLSDGLRQTTAVHLSSEYTTIAGSCICFPGSHRRASWRSQTVRGPKEGVAGDDSYFTSSTPTARTEMFVNRWWDFGFR